MKVHKDLRQAVAKAGLKIKGFWGDRTHGICGKYHCHVGRYCAISDEKERRTFDFYVSIRIGRLDTPRIFRGLKLRVERGDGGIAMETIANKEGLFYFVLPIPLAGKDRLPYKFSVVT